jgi:hypothetical protein
MASSGLNTSESRHKKSPEVSKNLRAFPQPPEERLGYPLRKVDYVLR